MKKIIKKVVEKCIDCPYFKDCEGRISCSNLWKDIERKDFKIIDEGFPDWCPLKDFKEGEVRGPFIRKIS